MLGKTVGRLFQLKETDLIVKCDVYPFSRPGFQELPGGPVVETLCFQCRGRGFSPSSGNRSHMLHSAAQIQ